MFIVATKKEFLESKWLKREYETYFNIHENPIQICISPNVDLPTSLKRIQNINPDAGDFEDSVVSYCKRNDISINEVKYKNRKTSSETSKVKEKFQELETINRTFNQKQYNSAKSEFLGKLDEIVEENTNIKYQQSEFHQEVYYASRIQESFLRTKDDVNQLFPDYKIEILYRPKNIVGGDFYWFHKENDRLIAVCADGTGHSIPGAFMALIGMTLLKKIVVDSCITKPSEILRLMNIDLEYLLRSNSESTILDGFDMSIVSIDMSNKRLEFAGAYHPLYIVRNEGKTDPNEGAKFEVQAENGDLYKLMEYKGDRKPVGFRARASGGQYENRIVNLVSGDRIFLCSDGFADQFGGPRSRKFTVKQLKTLLTVSSSVNINELFSLLNREFDQWKGNEQQVDDVLVMGMEV
jgi:serine phosphatase RsbU (regulator of sigma subunit)